MNTNRLTDTMGKRSAKIYVTKLAAAQRQLCAAIRMFFAGEDELAVHTVASAAYQVLSDLKAERGRDEAADSYLTSIFYAVRAYRRGKLPDYLANDPEIMQRVREMADRLPVTASSKFEDIRASVSPTVAQDFWRRRNAISNFLKHADRDAKSHISLDDVDNLYLLFQAASAYVDLTNDNLGPEGFVLWVYVNAVKGMKDGMPKQFRKYASRLEELDPDEQIRFCSKWIHRTKNATSAGR